MKTLLAAVTTLSLGGIALATRPAAPAEPAAPTTLETYAVDAAHSSVVFKTKHLGVAEFFGRFNAVDGEIAYSSDAPETSSVRIEIPVASLDTNNEGRDDHLRNADFFSAKEFPKVTFESASVAMDGEDMLVTGDLTVRGTTKSVEAKVRKIGEGEAMNAYRAGFTAHFTMDMRDFGFQFVQQRPGAVGPEVDVWVALELTKQ